METEQKPNDKNEKGKDKERPRLHEEKIKLGPAFDARPVFERTPLALRAMTLC